MKTESVRQFLACARTLFDFEHEADSLRAIESRQKAIDEIDQWYRDLRTDLLEARHGYPSRGPVRTRPELEDRLVGLLEGTAGVRRKPLAAPVLCLSHDIDYLRPTAQLNLKRTIGYRKISLLRRRETFVASLRQLLETSASVAGRKGVATVFFAAPAPGKSWAKRLRQWVLDPSYRLHEPLFDAFLETVREFHCEIGLHGSFYSLEDDRLAEERAALEKRVGHPVAVGRQHWLNLAGPAPFDRIAASGVAVDSSAGWNGAVGFRGGFARPFPWLGEEGRRLWQVPLVLMDGPLFDDLALDEDRVVAKAKELLTPVRERGGAVALDWHDRAAHASYGWAGAYQRILQWAKEAGFQFSTLGAAVAERTRDNA